MTDSVVICIPTFKRPKMLKRLLDAIAATPDKRISEFEYLSPEELKQLEVWN